MHARGYSPSECPNARSQPTAVPVQIGLICAPAATPGNNYSPRRVGDLALCVYVKGLRSNCRRDVSVLAESWKIMHSCAYMRPGATPSIRHECASSPLRGCAPRCPRSARSARLIEMVTQASPPCRTGTGTRAGCPATRPRTVIDTLTYRRRKIPRCPLMRAREGRVAGLTRPD